MQMPGLTILAASAALLSACADRPMTLSSAAAATQSDQAQSEMVVASADNAQQGGGSATTAQGAEAEVRSHALHVLIERHARENAVPVALANAVIRIESNYNARIVHAGNYGLMQIRLGTARALGFAGTPQALLDPEVNLRLGLKYLADAYRATQGDLCRTVMKYQSGSLALRMSAANRNYCRRVKLLMGS